MSKQIGLVNCLPALLFLLSPITQAQSAMVQLFQSQQVGKTNHKYHKPSKHEIVDDIIEKTDEQSRSHKTPMIS